MFSLHLMGVAPVAKLEQQRNRRYKTWHTNNFVSDEETLEEKMGYYSNYSWY